MASSVPSTDDSENIINFDEAMAQFTSMFPSISRANIEAILRKHNGDVSSTIDELLQGPSSASCQSSSKSSFRKDSKCAEKPKFGGKTVETHYQTTVEPECSKQQQKRPTTESTVDDEKIALLIQNREFLRYLRSDPNFMRELHGHLPSYTSYRHGHHHSRHRHGHYQQVPMLLASSRARSSPHTQRFDTAPWDYPPPMTPNGPLVEFSTKNHIPDGPLIDYVDTKESKWTQKLKSKFSTSSSKSSSGFIPITNDDDQQSGDQQDQRHCEPVGHPIRPEETIFSQLNDEQFASKLQNLSRNSKSVLLTLAKKFRGQSQHQHQSALSPRPIPFISTASHLQNGGREDNATDFYSELEQHRSFPSTKY